MMVKMQSMLCLLLNFFTTIWSLGRQTQISKRMHGRQVERLANLASTKLVPFRLHFSIMDYASEAIVPIPGTFLDKEQIFTDIASSVANFQEINSYVILVDINVRSIDDLRGNVQISVEKYPFWERFIKKLSTSKQDLSIDKFMYVHDVGVERVCKVALARIPAEMYQKLELGRKIAESVGLPGDGNVIVSMVSTFGENLVDYSMCDAMMSAYQAHKFNLPSMKSPVKSVGNPLLEVASTVRLCTPIIFVVPIEVVIPSIDEALSIIENSDESTDDATVEIFDSGDDVIDINNSINKMFQENGLRSELPENQDDNSDDEYTKFSQYRSPYESAESAAERANKISDLEKKMLEASQSDPWGGWFQPDTQFKTSSSSSTPSLEEAMSAASSNPWGSFESSTPKNNIDSVPSSNASLSQIEEFYQRNQPAAKLGQSFSKDSLFVHLNTAQVCNHGNDIARALCMLPPNVLDPGSYSALLDKMATAYGWEFKEFSAQTLKDEGCGAFYAVCQGNDQSSPKHDRLVKLTYNPPQEQTSSPPASPFGFQSTGVTLGSLADSGGSSSRSTTSTTNVILKKDRPVVLVGKGVCYDTGGVNVKSANSMKTMKQDMGGSAAALGVFMTLTTLKVPYIVECWLALVENNLNEKAYRPDDVVTAVTGQSIEVVHTDAEGRMLLADVLALASRKIKKPTFHAFGDVMSPSLVIDFATLTGTTISSLSNRYIGVFTNRKELTSDIIRAGEKSGERLWPFPVDEDFEDDLKSDIADLLQCRQPTEADHIYAAAFLNKFVNPAVPWIHMDLGSAYRPGGLGHIGSDYTGAGVRSAIEVLRTLSMVPIV